MSGWNYFATNLDTRGGATLLAGDLPLAAPVVTSTLSGPGGLTATIPVEVERLRGPVYTVFEPWRTCIWAEYDGIIRGGGIIVDDLDIGEPEVELSCKGFSYYPTGTPYNLNKNYIQADPFTIAREFWSDLQARNYSNLGLKVACSPASTPIRLGHNPPAEAEKSDGDTEDLQPYKINFYDTLDMGAWWEGLTKDGQFDFYESHQWAPSKNTDPQVGDPVELVHTLHLGYPTVGRDLRSSPSHRFEVGVNVTEVPNVVVSADDYCDFVLVVGAGEGSKAVRGTAVVRNRGRLHRTKVVQDSTLKTPEQVQRRAAQLASQYAGDENISTLKVANHSFAPYGSYGVGDTIQILGSGKGWAGELNMSVRIIGINVSPDEGDAATLTVARPDKVSSDA